jgi:hypothetical protein
MPLHHSANTKARFAMPFAVMLCAVLCARGAIAQSGPAIPPAALGAEQQSSHRELDGKCKAVQPGDVVHFTLRVDGVQYARAVYADLQMRLGRVYVKDTSGLPAPDFRNLGGGGSATRDTSQGNVYHFAFTVPRDVSSGLYHGSGVYVTAAPNDEVAYGGARSVDVTAHTMKEIRKYCLIVVSPLGGEGRPLVTDFKGGPVERKVASSVLEPASSRIFLPTR